MEDFTPGNNFSLFFYSPPTIKHLFLADLFYKGNKTTLCFCKEANVNKINIIDILWSHCFCFTIFYLPEIKM